jgi:hypothetical protein
MMSALSQIIKNMHEDAQKWCQGRLGYPRVVFPIWFALILVYLWRDPWQRGILDWPNLFSGLNFGIHEFGHVLFAPLGSFMGILGASLFQCLVPIIGMGMMLKQRDYFGITVCGAWLCSNMFHVAAYIADARAMALPLVSPFSGHPIHDWNYLLSRMGLLGSCEGLAILIKILATVIMLASIAGACYLIWLMIEAPPPNSSDWDL